MGVVLDLTQREGDVPERDKITLHNGREALLVERSEIELSEIIELNRIGRLARNAGTSDDVDFIELQLYRDLYRTFIPDMTDEEILTLKSWQMDALTNFLSSWYQGTGSTGSD